MIAITDFINIVMFKKFDHNKQLIILTMITLSGFHCKCQESSSCLTTIIFFSELSKFSCSWERIPSSSRLSRRRRKNVVHRRNDEVEWSKHVENRRHNDVEWSNDARWSNDVEWPFRDRGGTNVGLHTTQRCKNGELK
jgi:hypothetical protein